MSMNIITAFAVAAAVWLVGAFGLAVVVGRSFARGSEPPAPQRHAEQHPDVAATVARPPAGVRRIVLAECNVLEIREHRFGVTVTVLPAQVTDSTANADHWRPVDLHSVQIAGDDRHGMLAALTDAQQCDAAVTLAIETRNVSGVSHRTVTAHRPGLAPVTSTEMLLPSRAGH